MDTSAWITSLNSGILPKWQLLVAVISIANSVQVYLTTQYAARVYPGAASGRAPTSTFEASAAEASSSARASPPSTSPSSAQPSSRSSKPAESSSSPSVNPTNASSPVTPFGARMFGNWTVLSGIIRLYCALHVSNPLVYQLTIWTYVVVCTHLLLEVFVYGTTGPAAGRAIVGSAVIGPSSLAWMLLQWGHYVK